MVAMAVISDVLAGLGSWLVLGVRLFSPLEAITDTVEQINRADDLSRRIPYRGPADDEVGNLSESFNQTLERLESLFTSQQRFIADVSHELRTTADCHQRQCGSDAPYEAISRYRVAFEH